MAQPELNGAELLLITSALRGRITEIETKLTDKEESRHYSEDDLADMKGEQEAARVLEARLVCDAPEESPADKITMRCAKCGGDDCGLDATAAWNDTTQAWELNTTFDASWCDACGHDDPGLEEVPLVDDDEDEEGETE